MKIIDYIDIRIAAEPITFQDEVVFEKIADYVIRTFSIGLLKLNTSPRVLTPLVVKYG